MAFGCLGYITNPFIRSCTFSCNYYSFQVINGRKIMHVAKELLRASKSWVCLQIQLNTTKQQIRITEKECREKIINPPFFHHVLTVFKGLFLVFCWLYLWLRLGTPSFILVAICRANCHQKLLWLVQPVNYPGQSQTVHLRNFRSYPGLSLRRNGNRVQLWARMHYSRSVTASDKQINHPL